MTGIAVLAVLVVAGLGFLWSRMTTSRAERRSVDTYERQLDVLGHVSQRSDASAGIKKPTASELARPHVQPSGHMLPSNEYRPVSPPRVRLEPPAPPVRIEGPVAVPVQSGPLPVFGDEVEPITGRFLGKVSEDAFSSRSKLFRRNRPLGAASNPLKQTQDAIEQLQDASVVLPEPVAATHYEMEEPLFALDSLVDDSPSPTEITPAIVFDDVDAGPPVVRSLSQRSTRHRRISDHTHRRVLTSAAAVIVVIAIGVGGWQIASKQSPTVVHPSVTTTQHTHTSKTHKTSPFSSALGSSIQPITTSGSLVTYPAPSGTYTISFSSGSDCWLGIQPGSGSSGTYLAMKTLTSADSWTYQASGAIMIRIGAPKTLSVKINGETVALPSTVQPYDITFVPSGVASA